MSYKMLSNKPVFREADKVKAGQSATFQRRRPDVIKGQAIAVAHRAPQGSRRGMGGGKHRTVMHKSPPGYR